MSGLEYDISVISAVVVHILDVCSTKVLSETHNLQSNLS